MKTFSIFLGNDTMVEVRASNIRSAYKKVCDVGDYKRFVTEFFIEYDKTGIDVNGWKSNEESRGMARRLNPRWAEFSNPIGPLELMKEGI